MTMGAAPTASQPADGGLLPPADEREALLDALAELVKEGGATGFLGAPIVEPTERFFPDRFEADEASFARLARRLLRDALFEDVQVELVALEDLEDEAIPGPRGCGGGRGGCAKPGCAAPAADVADAGPAVLPVGFVGIGDGVFRFVAPEIDLRDKERLVAWAVREVARAYRVHRNLPQVDPELEEMLLDVTACYLGFGVLLANEALRRHAESHIEGRMVQTTRWVTSVGVISPASFSWLLAAQVSARGRDEADRVAELLRSEPRDAFRRATSELRRVELRSRLGLPATDPDEQTREGLEAWMIQPLSDDAVAAIPGASARWRAPNTGRPVFRVRQNRMWLGLAMGAVAGIAFTAYAIRGSVVLAYLVPATMALGAAWLGRRSVSFVCSDPACGTSLAPGLAQCPGCGGSVSGEIARASDRLAAEEALERRPRGYRDAG